MRFNAIFSYEIESKVNSVTEKQNASFAGSKQSHWKWILWLCVCVCGRLLCRLKDGSSRKCECIFKSSLPFEIRCFGLRFHLRFLVKWEEMNLTLWIASIDRSRWRLLILFARWARLILYNSQARAVSCFTTKRKWMNESNATIRPKLIDSPGFMVDYLNRWIRVFCPLNWNGTAGPNGNEREMILILYFMLRNGGKWANIVAMSHTSYCSLLHSFRNYNLKFPIFPRKIVARLCNFLDCCILRSQSVSIKFLFVFGRTSSALLSQKHQPRNG